MRRRRIGLSRWVPAAGAIAVVGLTLTSVPTAPPAVAGTTAVTATPDIATTWTANPSSQAPCPEGMARSSTPYSTSFESGMPWSLFARGWSNVTMSTLSGDRAARSTMSPTQSDPGEYFHLPQRKVSPGQHTRLAFASRGTFKDGRGWITANSVRQTIGGTSGWRGVNLNITSATDDDGGWIAAYFEQRRTPGITARWDVDNAQIFTCRNARTQRVAGANRYATAAAIANTYRVGQDIVFVARGDEFPDALAASALAGHKGAPMLLVGTNDIPGSAAQQLERLNPSSIVVLGGTTAISDTVETQLRGYATEVRRIAGANRFETSALLAQEFGTPNRVYIATGRAFPDTLSGGALAAHDGSPILLTNTGTLPSAVAQELDRIAPDEIVILGGDVAVRPAVEQELRTHARRVRRISGVNRWATSAAIASAFGANPPRSYLATGTGFADALTGSALAGHQSAPLLLTHPNAIPTPVQQRLSSMGERQGTVLGGEVAVASIVRDRYGRTLP